MPHRKYNLDASKLLVDHVAKAFRLHRHTADLIAGTRKAIIQSRALMADVDADLAMKIIPPDWLWPAY
jgi:hypothetical protein